MAAVERQQRTTLPPASDATLSVGPSERPVILTWAELAECTCPEFCERDHEQD